MLTKVTRNDLDEVVKSELNGLDEKATEGVDKADLSLQQNRAQEFKINSLSAQVTSLEDVTVKSVEGIFPDENGNVELGVGEMMVTSVNQQYPDGNGNVLIDDNSIPVINPYTSTQSMLNATLTDIKNKTARSVGGVTPDENGNIDLKIIGSGTPGANNTAWLGFYESDATTRVGFVGDGGTNDTNFSVVSEKGDVVLQAPSGKSIVAKNALYMSNFDITGLNAIKIADNGPKEGYMIGGGNGWIMSEADDVLTNNNNPADLQFTTTSADFSGTQIRRATVRADGSVWAANGFDANNKVVYNVANGANGNHAVNKSQLDGKLSLPVKLAPGTDLNNVKQPGMHYSSANADNCVNVPLTGTAFSLLNEQHAGTKQTWTSYGASSNPRIFVRNFYQSWGPWVEVIHENGPVATTSKNGLMSASDKSALDNLSATGLQRNTTLSEMGFANTFFDSFTSLEDVMMEVVTKADSLYETVPVRVEQYCSPTTFTKICTLSVAEINDNPEWKDIPWAYMLLTVEMYGPSTASSGLVKVIIQDVENYQHRYETTYRPTSNSFSKWMDHRGKLSNMAKVLWSGGPKNEGTITLSESLENFDTLVVAWNSGISHKSETTIRSASDDGITHVRFFDSATYSHFDSGNGLWYAYEDSVSFNFVNATTLSPVSDTGKYIVRVMNRSSETMDIVLDASYGITKILGLHRRQTPREMDFTGLFDVEVETPNIEPEIGTMD